MNMQRTKARFIFSLLLGPFLVLGINCRKEHPEETYVNFNLEDFKGKNGIVLTVEDSTYYNSDFENYIRSLVGNAQEDLTTASLSRLYDKFIDERILLQAAKNQKVFLTSEEEREYLAKLRNQFWGKDRELDDLDIQIIFDKLLIEKYTYQLVKDIEVGEEEIEEYYKLHKKDFLQSERVRVSQILVKNKDKAVEILERVKKASPEDFRKIAQQESIGTEASKGGDMGLFEMGQLPYEMESVIFSLKDGELSPVVESSYGYHIFRLDRRDGLVIIPLEKASENIKLILLDQKIREAISQHLEALKKSLSWDSNPQNLSFQYQRNSS